MTSIPREPLAYRMRPCTFDDFVGQEHILSPGKPLRILIENDHIQSLILYGPPGCGKSALAYIIRHQTQSHFQRLNAVTSGVADVRRLIHAANDSFALDNKRTIVFIDEIHRFNKTQQDALLPSVESGEIILIGATTQNPYFFINPALQSRSHIYELNPLNENNLSTLITIALQNKERGLGNYTITITKEAVDFFIRNANGDARKLLGSLELAVLSAQSDNTITIDIAHAQNTILKKSVNYDGTGDQHYDVISAFIKSIRGSDPDAAIYWLALMLHAGEDPRFIARRLCISASEDIGNADPIGLLIAHACMDIVSFIGMPEARITLAQTTTYLASAPKSNSAYRAIDTALEDIRTKPQKPVPAHLQDSSYASAKKLGRGQEYIYPHDHPGHYYPQQYMPEYKQYYFPGSLGFEEKIEKRIAHWKSLYTKHIKPSQK